MKLAGLVGPALGCLLAICRPAAAEPRDLDQTQPLRYYQATGGLIVAGFGLSGLGWQLFKDAPAGRRWGSFRLDDPVERNFNGAAAALSDQFLISALAMPLVFQVSHGPDVTATNASMIYAEAQSLNSLLAMTAKLVARRPRPYTHSRVPQVQQFARDVGTDASMSFFSGHTSTTFTAATAGSILYAARSDVAWARYTHVGLGFTLAGLTAQLRVCAGRHYRTDVWTGMLMGIGIGVLVPWLNDVDLSRVKISELGVAAGATVLTMGVTEAVGFCGLVQHLGLRDVPLDILSPVELPGESEGGEPPPPVKTPAPAPASFFVLPTVLESGFGLSLYGEL